MFPGIAIVRIAGSPKGMPFSSFAASLDMDLFPKSATGGQPIKLADASNARPLLPTPAKGPVALQSGSCIGRCPGKRR